MSKNSASGISIIIPVYNGGKAFGACLKSLKALDPPPFEIIVVGDGDTDGSAERARAAGFTVIASTRRRGQAKARNLGAQRAGGDILFFLDADVSPSSDVVGRVAENFADDPGLSACFGSYDDAPADPGFLSQYRNLLHHYVHQNGNADASTFWTGCGAIRRDIFRSLKGFDTRYKRPAMEDIELGYRLKRQTRRILLDKHLLVKHHKKWTILSVLETDFVDRALPWTRLILREGRFIGDLNLRVRDRLSVICVFMCMISAALIVFSAVFLIPIFFCALLLGILNRDLYIFLCRKRGFLFSLGAVFWHWLYYLYSGLAFGLGLCEFGLRKFMRWRKKRFYFSA